MTSASDIPPPGSPATPASSRSGPAGPSRATLAVTVGRPDKVVDAPLNPPVVFASTYVGALDPAEGHLGYGRYGNPTWLALEEAIGALEGGRAVTFASGMAAADAVLAQVPPGGTLVLPDNCYSGVSALADQQGARHGWTVRRISVADTEQVVRAAAGADLVWIETPTNPNIEVADLPALGAALADKTTLVVDNTFATPILQRPLESGAQIVMHSATKFIAGHSDALIGALVVGRDDAERYAALEAARRLRGATPGTMEAYLALRGLRTLPLRLERAQANAGLLAARLAEHPKIGRVRYPGLADDPGHAVAARTMDGFGSIISIELDDAKTADRFVDAADIWVFATSLGGVESTFERRRRWAAELPSVAEGLVRLSVGIEDVEDLWADLAQALDQA